MKKPMIIRQETENDYGQTEKLVEEAFRDLEFSEHNEHLLVQKLRQSRDFIPELSLVAEMDNKIVGHILFSKVTIIGDKEFESLCLAPVSVLPGYQNQGIGSELIKEGLLKAEDLGFESVLLVGHSTYYPRFGFEKASKWNIRCAFEVPEDVFMAIELKIDALKNKSGLVRYPAEFGLP
jgi:predicted N-acetyltransferase YhbS